MARAEGTDYNTYRVCLGVSEEDTVRRHAERECLSIDEAMSDLVEQKLAEVALAFCREEDEARGVVSFDAEQLSLLVKWPNTGPMTALDDQDRAFVTMMINVVASIVLTQLITAKAKKGIKDVMERKDEGNGSGKPIIPFN